MHMNIPMRDALNLLESVYSDHCVLAEKMEIFWAIMMELHLIIDFFVPKFLMAMGGNHTNT